MVNYTIAVPSRSRPEILRDWTLTALRRANVPDQQVTLVLDEDQIQDYALAIDLDSYNVTVTPMEFATNGIHAKRNWLQRQYPAGTRLVQIDDDVKGLYVAVDRSTPLKPMKSLPDHIEWAFEMTQSLGLSLWGMYPADNPYFMRQEATTDTRYIVGCVHGWTLVHDDTDFVTLDAKDDYERTIRFAIRDGGVLRMNWATFKTQYYSLKGGMQEYRTDAIIEDRAIRLAAMYPEHAVLAGAKGHRGKTEVRLRRGTAVVPPIPTPAHLLG